MGAKRTLRVASLQRQAVHSGERLLEPTGLDPLEQMLAEHYQRTRLSWGADNDNDNDNDKEN